jgi:hypothetical protein
VHDRNQQTLILAIGGRCYVAPFSLHTIFPLGFAFFAAGLDISLGFRYRRVA